MRLSVLIFALVCGGALVIGSAAPPPQDQEEDVRGAFLTSRPKDKGAAPETKTKPSHRRPKPSATPNNPGKPPEKKPTNPAGPSDTAKNSGSAKPVNVKRIGLGMTLFTRDSNGLAVRVDPEHVFRKGDRVRLVLETNTDGYLYIFNTTNDGPPILIYPDADLDEAGNYMQAHVPFEIPSSTADQERFRWLVFDEYPGTEKLFLVFTREPLNGVPIEDDLISFCKAPDAKCPWRPPTEVWELVQKQMQEPLATDNKNARFGRAITAPEEQANTRGLSLAKDDPEPSVIMMASSTSPMLVATLDLIHK
jgi:uncharacterized protein DUF4384